MFQRTMKALLEIFTYVLLEIQSAVVGCKMPQQQRVLFWYKNDFMSIIYCKCCTESNL